MKTLDEIVKDVEQCLDTFEREGCFYCNFQRNCKGDGICEIADILYYLYLAQEKEERKCSNCKCWHGRKNYSPDDPWREEYFCGYETWTYPDDSCSRWEKMDEDVG